MIKRYTQVPITYLEPIFEDWRKTYSLGDTLSVFFMPHGDHLFRALQFVDYMREIHSSDVLLVNMESDGIGPESFKTILYENVSRDILILAKRLFMTPEARYYESVLETWHAKTGLGIVILHEGFPSQLTANISSTILTQKLLVHKIYSPDVALEFVDAVVEQFGHELSRELKMQIVEYCGGCAWLLVDVLRRNSTDKLFDDPVFNWKVGSIISRIPDIANIDKDLIEMGLKDANGEWLPVFEDYLSNQKKDSLSISQDRVICNQIDVTREFSDGERKILSLFIEKKNNIQTREAVGEIFWGEGSEMYSDWALDALVSRLRKKLRRLRLPINIKTYRGRGYACT